MTGKATESREAAGVRAGDSVAAVGSIYAFSSGWATTEAPKVVPWLDDMAEMCMCIVVVVCPDEGSKIRRGIWPGKCSQGQWPAGRLYEVDDEKALRFGCRSGGSSRR